MQTPMTQVQLLFPQQAKELPYKNSRGLILTTSSSVFVLFLFVKVVLQT